MGHARGGRAARVGLAVTPAQRWEHVGARLSAAWSRRARNADDDAYDQPLHYGAVRAWVGVCEERLEAVKAALVLGGAKAAFALAGEVFMPRLPPPPPVIFERGDAVALRLGVESVRAEVILASGNGCSLMVEFRGALFAGYVERMPLLWDGQHFRDLAVSRVVLVEPAALKKRFGGAP